MHAQADWNRINRFGVRGILAFLNALVPGFLFCLMVSVVPAQTDEKNVLVIYSYFNSGANPFLDTIKSSLRARVPKKVKFYVTNPASSRWDDEAYRESLADKLVASDSGRGFDIGAVKQNRGPGLVSMQERVHLVHGNLYLESGPAKGTKILAIVPLQ